MAKLIATMTPGRRGRVARRCAASLALATAITACGSGDAQTVSPTTAPVTSQSSASTDGPDASTAPEPSSGPTTEAPTTTEGGAPSSPIHVSYEFPSGLFELDFVNQPTQVQGVLGVPEGVGPFPVAMIFHGSHLTCDEGFLTDYFSDIRVIEEVTQLCPVDHPEYLRNDVGLGYIVEQLVTEGFAAVSVDVNSAYVWWGGEVSEPEVFAAVANVHYEILQRLNDGDDLGLGLPSLEGRLELSSPMIVGHSRSGAAVMGALQPNSGLPFVPGAVVALQPGVPFIAATVEPVPLLLIRGGCDEDLGPDTMLEFVAGWAPEFGEQPVIDLLIPKAGHGMVNSGLIGSGCAGEIETSVVHSQVARAISSFASSSGDSIELIVGADATVTALNGAEPLLTEADPAVAYDPAGWTPVESVTELLPPIPPDADYSGAFDEDF